MTARGQAKAPACCMRRVAWIALVLPAWFSGAAWATQSGPTGQASSVRITEAITRYTLDATSIDGLRSQLHHEMHLPRGKAGTHARTRSDIAIAYEVDDSAAGCRLRDLDVRLDIVVTLPEWAPGAAVPDWQYARWKRTLAALERHEATHRANARAAAEEVRVRILAIGLQPDCRLARSKASRVLRKTMLKYEMRDRRYDARTRNGTAEGVEL